jgi:predicted regulator of Ras-like GTPase activity (Roadblock/LC7/MglB family)
MTLWEEMAVQIPEPTVPLSTPNGKSPLPTPTNGSMSSLPPAREEKDDPPTAPLPSIQGSLRAYAAQREPSPLVPKQEAAPGIKLAIDSLPGQAITQRHAPAVTPPPVPQPAPLEAMRETETAPLVPPQPPAEPKLSSLALLEQLAYGGAGNNGSAEPVSLDVGISAPTLVPPAFVGAAPALGGAPAAPLASGGAEGGQSLQGVLETFAEQVGAACVATAVIRSDGLLLAECKVRRGQDQDLASPAYHMAHVMQSSLRALLMGGWGDLEDTFITGSTHSLMLRRLGRAEKGLFHIAVLERSGNSGLCRVRMRNSEASLLQALSVDLPTATS